MSIVSIDYTRQCKGSVFECDRCHRKINTKNEKRYVIDISKSKLGQSGLEKKIKSLTSVEIAYVNI